MNFVLSICLTCKLIDGLAFSLFFFFYPRWPGDVWLSCRGAGISRVDSCGPSCQRDICRIDSVGYCDGMQGLGSRNDRQDIKNGTIQIKKHTSMPVILICSCLKKTEKHWPKGYGKKNNECPTDFHCMHNKSFHKIMKNACLKQH